MKPTTVSIALLLAVAQLGGTSIVSADTAAATCEVRKEGETKQGASGPCDFSQRQGYVSINLKNGDRYELSPTDKPDHYKDQKGKSVVLTVRDGVSEYKWEGGKKIIVRFDGGGRAASSGGGAGDPVPALQDLVGARGGSAEDALRSRGYTWARTEKSGNDSYSYWRENENGQCVVVRTADGRYQSIAYATDFDCKGGGGGHSANQERKEEFATVCGVMVAGEDYRYRCRVEDYYSGGSKTRTVLHFPDQTIELTWKGGNRVGLQFEGMVPKEARYATSEGETNWVFEDKTYYYYSNKEVARREVESFRD